VREVARNTLRIQKALEDANIKLSTVVCDILGKSGRAVLDALAAGESDPEKLVELTQGRLKAPREKMLEALRGKVRDHHRFVIELHLAQIDALHQAVRELEAHVEEHLKPFRQNVEILTTMPGIGETAATVIVS
jgi:transposase